MGEPKADGQRERKVLSEEVARRRRRLFDLYVTPNKNMIYKLCINYSYNLADVEDNYMEVLANIYRYIETYDRKRSLQTWLHIVTKRCVHDCDKKRKRQKDLRDMGEDVENCPDVDAMTDGNESVSWNIMGMDNYRELYNDDILKALDMLKPQYRRALLYQQAGYTVKEIAVMEKENGALDSGNVETVKSRLRIARQELRKTLDRDGRRRKTEQ